MDEERKALKKWLTKRAWLPGNEYALNAEENAASIIDKLTDSEVASFCLALMAERTAYRS